MSKYDFSVKQPKRTAKAKLSNILLLGVKTFRPDGKVKVMGFSFDILNILLPEIGKVDEKMAQRFLEDVQRELEAN